MTLTSMSLRPKALPSIQPMPRSMASPKASTGMASYCASVAESGSRVKSSRSCAALGSAGQDFPNMKCLVTPQLWSRV